MRTTFSLPIFTIVILALHSATMLGMSEAENQINEQTITLVKDILKIRTKLPEPLVENLTVKYGKNFDINLQKLVMTVPHNTSRLKEEASCREPEILRLKGKIINLGGKLYYRDHWAARYNIPVVSNITLQHLADEYEVEHTHDTEQLHQRGVELRFCDALPGLRANRFLDVRFDLREKKQD